MIVFIIFALGVFVMDLYTTSKSLVLNNDKDMSFNYIQVLRIMFNTMFLISWILFGYQIKALNKNCPQYRQVTEVRYEKIEE